MTRRVVVTGLGVLAPNGNNTLDFWASCLEGRSAVRPIETFDVGNFAVQAAGEIRNFKAADFVRNRKSLKVMAKNIQYGIAAAAMAMEHSGLKDSPPVPERFGVVMGAGIVPTEIEEVAEAVLASLDDNGEFDLQRFASKGQKLLFPLWLLKHLPNMVSAHISIIHQAQGPNDTIVTACTAGTQAIGDAMQNIQSGEADVMLTGGTDSRIDPFSLISYCQLGAISTSNRPLEQLSRPFDREHDGFVLGEGAACLVLESEEHATARGATIYSELAGYANTFDSLGVAAKVADGNSAARAMRGAIDDAGISTADVDYVSAHGTSTVLNDRLETLAAKAVFGDRAHQVPMSSIKSMIGHLICAAGAVEAVASVLAIHHDVVPPTINFGTPDPVCDLDYVPNVAREMNVSTVLSNSFGLGGQNASIVLREYKR